MADVGQPHLRGLELRHFPGGPLDKGFRVLREGEALIGRRSDRLSGKKYWREYRKQGRQEQFEWEQHTALLLSVCRHPKSLFQPWPITDR